MAVQSTHRKKKIEANRTIRVERGMKKLAAKEARKAAATKKRWF